VRKHSPGVCDTVLAVDTRLMLVTSGDHSLACRAYKTRCSAVSVPGTSCQLLAIRNHITHLPLAGCKEGKHGHTANQNLHAIQCWDTSQQEGTALVPFGLS